MKKNFDEKTQGYIDKTLLTLNTWFGSAASTIGGQPTSGGQTPIGGGGLTPPPRTPRPSEDDNKKGKTGLYVGIGVGVLAIAGLTIYLVKKAKK